ncbi:ABC transporter permease subunit [Marinactinospora thermotolerans]|uniref:Amino acid/amide ABC transporter membrane protein 1, HAAT family n=1 Tax=Marinactinospora thermotolerans DSM 45154 TaxID=1122192 RepID=A0A1T4KQN9_9ACTN|nr:branched-chain amino acid ABC transporter permease [Marinactinospora thermotolerans]SJZ44721.1 amino acid/amide ABC transporter membrane protein 1, HAAT family [Marinactinospora thermotolerans DSM 45154]
MRRRLVTVLLAVITAILVIPAGAVADDQGGETLNGQIRKPETVEGIDITVYQGSEEIGTATTGPDGEWEVEVPGPGAYRVVLDQESVPDEYVVSERPGPEHDEVQVREGQQRTVIFNLARPGEEEGGSSASPSEPAQEAAEEEPAQGEGTPEGVTTAPGVSSATPFGTKVVQLTVAGISFGLVIAISAIGLSLIFGTTRMINFAHGDMVTFGAMMALLFSTGATFNDVPLVVAALIAVVLGALLGIGLERFLWRPLRRRNVALIQMFIVSIGVALILRHLLLVGFGGNRERYDEYQLQEMIRLGPVGVTPRELTIICLSVLVLVAVAAMLQFTRIGKAMRAVADNRDLAESSGIDVDRVTLYVWGLGGGLSALGGVFYGLSQSVYWQMGFHLLLLMFAAVILGGLGTAYGAMVGGLVIGLVAQLSTLWFPSELMNAWALAIMIVVLLVRPQGILGRRERVG